MNLRKCFWGSIFSFKLTFWTVWVWGTSQTVPGEPLESVGPKSSQKRVILVASDKFLSMDSDFQRVWKTWTKQKSTYHIRFYKFHHFMEKVSSMVRADWVKFLPDRSLRFWRDHWYNLLCTIETNLVLVSCRKGKSDFSDRERFCLCSILPRKIYLYRSYFSIY